MSQTKPDKQPSASNLLPNDAPADTQDNSRSLLTYLSTAFFNDKRLLALTIIVIVVAGLSSLMILPRMEDPLLTPRAALVITRMPGANAERVESLVTEKIESSLRDVDEIKELKSVSRAGISTITVELRDDIYESDAIWAKVRGRIEDAIADLPPEAARPIFDELETKAYSLILGMTWQQSGPADYRVLRRLAIDLQDKLQNVSGTEIVDRFGDPGEEIEVRVDPLKASAMGLRAGTIARQIAQNDAKGTAGQLRAEPMSMLIEVDNQLDAVANIGRIPIASRNGKDIRLEEVSDISLTVPNPLPRAALLDGNEAVVLGALVRSDTRIDLWTAKALRLVDEYEKTLPDGIAIDRMLIQNKFVSDRLETLVANLLMGATGVAVVIFFMMGWRSAVIVSLTLPLASLMVLFAMRVYGIPIHQMSVTGLIIAFGLLIDNAIVVVDEVKSRLRQGRTAVDSMTQSVSHLAVPLLGSTLTTAFAFAPIALMPGPGGEFVGSIATGVIMSIFASLLLALTVIPTIASRLVSGRYVALEDADGSRKNAVGSNEVRKRGLHGLVLDGIHAPAIAKVYEQFIGVCLRRPWIGVVVGLLLPVTGFYFASTLKEQFFPPTDRNQFHVQLDLPITAAIAETRRTAEQVDRYIRESGARRVDWFFGGSAPEFYYNVIGDREGQPNFAHAIVTLPDGENPKTMLRGLQEQLDRHFVVPRILVRQLEQGPPFEAPVEVRLFGPDLQELRRLGHEVRRRINNMPEVVAVRTDLSQVLPQLSFRVDDAVAAAAGITPAAIADQLATTLEGARGGNVLQDNEELPVVVRVGGEDRSSLARIESLDLMVDRGGEGSRPDRIPVSALSTVGLVPETASIPRIDRRRMNEVSVYIQAGILPTVVQSRLERSFEDDPLDLQPGYEMKFGGEAGERDEAVGNLLSTVGLLMTMMVATLVLSFGSFRMAIIIGLVGLLSIGLALLSLVIGGYPFGFVAIIGTMGLLGVAINDSIVVLAGIRTNAAACEGDVGQATHEVMHATRHVLSTTITTVAGFSPLIIAGGDFWPPLAVAISGGVMGATLLALVFVPSLHQWWIAGRSRTTNS